MSPSFILERPGDRILLVDFRITYSSGGLQDHTFNDESNLKEIPYESINCTKRKSTFGRA